LHQHLFEVLCSREERDFKYLLNTMARLVQHPELPAEVAVVLRGDEGCGKGIIGRALYRIMGQHGLHISHPEHLRNKHNAHLRDCVFLFADEAFYAGDKQHESILKALITEDTLAIEPKNKDLVDVPNYLHMWMAGNPAWVVPASLRARRWFIPKVSEHRIGDREYFRALYREIDTGGLEAMLFELLHRDISNFDPRAVPLTEPLAVQKLHSLDTLHRWWMACLERGFIWCSRFGVRVFQEWSEFCTTELLMRSYLQWCDDNRLYQRQTRQELGEFMTKMYQGARPKVAHPVHEITVLPAIGRGADPPPADPAQPMMIELPGATLTEDIDPLERVAVVRKHGQYGYRLGDIEHARAAFMRAVGDLPMPWQPR
jgi:phage/plasmid-associated DNA primase